MTTVWIVQSCYEDTDCIVLDVFANELVALRFARKHGHLHTRVTEWEVDDGSDEGIEPILEATYEPQAAG